MKQKKTVLLCILIVTTLIAASAGAYLKYAVLKPLELYQDESVFAVPFLLMADEEAQQMLMGTEAETVPPETVQTESTAAAPDVQTPTTDATEMPTDPPVTQPTIVTEPEPVDESWFDDALFIGDSRTESFSVYYPLGNAHYFCNEGLSLFNVQDTTRNVGDLPGMTLKELLSVQPYGKIFIGLGINGIMQTHENILESYQNLISMIQETQPDAVIVLQAIMTVSRSKAETRNYFTPENIYELNGKIAQLAQDNGVCFIDTNEWIADDEGYLPDDLTKDGLHLYAPVYTDWAMWLMDTVSKLDME